MICAGSRSHCRSCLLLIPVLFFFDALEMVRFGGGLKIVVLIVVDLVGCFFVYGILVVFVFMVVDFIMFLLLGVLGSSFFLWWWISCSGNFDWELWVVDTT